MTVGVAFLFFFLALVSKYEPTILLVAVLILPFFRFACARKKRVGVDATVGVCLLICGVIGIFNEGSLFWLWLISGAFMLLVFVLHRVFSEKWTEIARSLNEKEGKFQAFLLGFVALTLTQLPILLQELLGDLPQYQTDDAIFVVIVAVACIPYLYAMLERYSHSSRLTAEVFGLGSFAMNALWLMAAGNKIASAFKLFLIIPHTLMVILAIAERRWIRRTEWQHSDKEA